MYKIYLDQVNYIYGKGTPFEHKALDNVSVGIREGCITGVIGHTGSGKSTMMQLLNGLSAPSEGTVLLDDYDVNTDPTAAYEAWKNLPEYQNLSKSAAKKAIKREVLKRKRELCYRVGLVMQYPEYQLFEETIAKDIAFGPKNMGLSEDEIRARVEESARFAGLDLNLLQKSPFDLSGGQKRRAAIAGIIAMEPKCIVLDEPTAMLDPKGRREVMETIAKLNQDKKITVVLITHHMDEAAQAQRVVVLHKGKVAADGTPKEVFSQVELLHNLGLAAPETVELCYELNKVGFNLPLDQLDINECAQTLYSAVKV